MVYANHENVYTMKISRSTVSVCTIVVLIPVCSFSTVTRRSLVTLIALDFLPVAGIVIVIAVIIYQHHLKTKKGNQCSIIIPFGTYSALSCESRGA